MRLIDADALKAIRFHDLPYSQIVPADCDTDEKVSAYKLGWNDAIDAIVESVPTVDHIKHGHWKRTDILFCRQNAVRCSCCGHLTPTYGKVLDSFCRFCGAEMDEVKEDG